MDKNLTLTRSRNNQTALSRLVAGPEPRRSLPGSSADPRFQPTVPGVQQKNTRGEKHRYSSQPVCVPDLNSSTSAMPISQRNRPSSSPAQASGPRYPLPNIIPQQIFYDEWGRQYFITPVRTAPAGTEQLPRGRRLRTSSRGAASPPITAPDLLPRDPWHQTTFQPRHHHPGFVYGCADPINNANWQEPQLTSPNGFSSMPGTGENDLCYPNMDDPPMQAGLNQFGNLQKPAPAVPTSSGILVAEENEMPFEDINVLPGQADFVQLGNLQEPAPAIPYGFSGMRRTGEAQISLLDMYTMAGQADFNPNGTWLAPTSTIPGGLPSTHRVEGYQLPLPEADLLPMQTGYIPDANWLDPVSVAPDDLSRTLGLERSQIVSHDINTVPIQSGFSPDGDWLDLASVAASDSSFGVEGNQSLSPDTNAPPMQTAYMPNGDLQEPVEPGSISNISGSEDTQTLEPHPGALSAEAVDALWKTIEEAEPGEFQEVLWAGQGQMLYSEEDESSEVMDFNTQDDSKEPNSSAAGNPLDVLAVGDQQAFERDEDTFSSRFNLSTVDAFQESGTASTTNQFSFIGTGQHQVSHADLGALSDQPVVSKGEDSDVVLPKLKGFEDARPTISIDTPSFYWSGDGELFNPNLDSLSGPVNPITEYGIPDVLSEIGAIGESHMSPEEALRQPSAENNGYDGELYGDV